MFWLLMTVLLLIAGLSMLRRRAAYTSAESEPWRESLADDEPLDIDGIREAEEEWLDAAEWEDLPEDDSWR